MFTEMPLEIERQIKSGIAVLKDGGLVAFPTDTIYGLGACFDNPDAVKRIYEVKKRPYDMALPLLVADELQISEITEYIPDIAALLIKKLLPGGLTLVLPKAESVPAIVTGGGETVAVRITDHPVTIALIRGVGKPITGTSANVSGKPSALTAEETRLQIGDKVDLIIDGGRCGGGIESTIIDVTGDIPRLLREGAIPRAEIEKVCRII